MSNKIVTGSSDDMKKSDYARFFNSDPDGFSPERNKFIVEQTIKDYEAMRAKKAKAQDEAYAERADATVTYLKSLDRGQGGESNLLKYFGKRELARLQGLEIKQKLMQGMTIRNQQGEIIHRGQSA